MAANPPNDLDRIAAFYEALRQTCKHPPARLYSWWACDDAGNDRAMLVVACRDCKAILRGAA